MELHGFLAIDKPLGWTSHDVVARLRRIIGTKRVGHAGTLDPAATGVLVAGVGRGTRFLDLVQAGVKEYVAHVVLGVMSDTADIDGRLIRDPSSQSCPSRGDVEAALGEFQGEIDQIPPKYSAVKQGGEPLYRRMRRGETVDAPVRQVRIDAIEVVSYRPPDLLLHIRCGTGVYIRSLAEDIGAALGRGAYVHHLLRTRVGRFTLEACWTLEDLADSRMPHSWPLVSTAIDAGIDSNPALALGREQVRAWYHGRSVDAVDRRAEGIDSVRAFTPDGTFAGLGSAVRSGAAGLRLQPRTVLAPS